MEKYCNVSAFVVNDEPKRVTKGLNNHEMSTNLSVFEHKIENIEDRISMRF